MAVAFAVGALMLASSTTTIATGFVGVKSRFGKVVEPLLLPGLHFRWPMIEAIDRIETRDQTDAVWDIPCITNESVALFIKKIEIGNQLPHSHVLKTVSEYGRDYDNYLVFDKIKHQISIICNTHTAQEITVTKFAELNEYLRDFIQSENDRYDTGLIIKFVRLSKPRYEKVIEDNFLKLAEEKSLKKVVIEKAERLKSEKQSEMVIAEMTNEIDIQKENNLNKLAALNAANKNRLMILAMKAKQEEQEIQNEMTISEAKANTEKKRMEVEVMQSFYSIPGYVDVQKAESIANNQKIYYGEKLPLFYGASFIPSTSISTP